MALTERENILLEAKAIVTQDRNTDYGTPEQNFSQIAALWQIYKGVKFEPHDVAIMLLLLKVARIATSPDKVDHWVDIAGYAACGGEVRPAQDAP